MLASAIIFFMASEQQPLDRAGIEKIIPHRRPFMFLGSAQVITPGVKAIGILADLSHSDFDYLRGHFPAFRVVPGAIIMEALAELSGIALGEQKTSKIGVLRRDTMDYKQMVRPEDVISLEAEIIAFKMGIDKSRVKATKGGKVAAEGEITFVLIDKPIELADSSS